VSRITVRRALAELENEGYLIRKQGKGTFVSIPRIEHNLVSFYSFSEEFKKRGYTPHNKVLNFELQRPDKEIRTKLRLFPPAQQVYYIKRFRYADDVLMAIEDTYIPASLFPGLRAEDLEVKPLYDIMREDYGIVPNSAEEIIGATIISENEAKHFGIKDNLAALHIERVTFSGAKCIEYTVGIVRGDRFRFRIKLN